ncbi:MAG: ATP-dependent helicase [Acidobacteriia bacterium]|nr:ATP-dependent helicase [Terriglobia bacterium]
MEFTRSQLRAIGHKDGNLQIIACAGSGKTEVVARRIANLLKAGAQTGLAPRNVVAFTFTDKAAAELKDRIDARCREELGNILAMAEMFVGTIHSFCLDLLMTEVPKYLKYDVLNEVQQSLFVDRHSRRSGLTTSTDLASRTLARYKDTPLYISALGILREDETNPRQLSTCSVVQGLQSYANLLDETHFFDYSSIMSTAVEILRRDRAIRERLSQRIKHVIVDEYQDVNPVQEAIVRNLHDLGATVCVVGDDDQTVYQWRGSDVGNILTFSKRYPKAKQIRLEDNFRSSPGIVETARAFIEQNKDRLPKKMQPTPAQTCQRGDIIAMSFNSPESEAAYIARTMHELRGVVIKEDGKERGIAWSDMAVLLRSVGANGEPITRSLSQAKIPYLVVGMNNLFGTAEAQAARALFYFMAGRLDASQLEDSWTAAGLGISAGDLRHAIENVQTFRESFDNPTERFSFYSIQRTFQTFLDEAGIREERVPNGRGEVVFYNLGKFSQLISDFETIHYHSQPKEKYATFANFLQYRAQTAYSEGWQENQYANPDAVRIMTIHQAKGMQWPAVFIPALLRNRFPSAAHGGRNVWHLIPKPGIKCQSRYDGSIEDERRLFYVAMTRSQKFLHMTWAPISGKNNRYRIASEFWNDILVSKYVKRRLPDYSSRKRLAPTPRRGVENVVFSFSDIKYFFECPYQFKLRILYGFNAPIHEALGYGRSLHNVLAEIHSRALRGEFVKEKEVGTLVDRHLHTPYAYQSLKDNLEAAAKKVVQSYIRDNKADFKNIEFSEKQIEIGLEDGVSVVGRIDLVRRIDTGETTIVDLKSSGRAQAEEVTETQLHIYALGYQELTGRPADYVEIYELDEGKRKPRSVDAEFIDDVKKKMTHAAHALRVGDLPAQSSIVKCKTCDYKGMCSAGVEALNQGASSQKPGRQRKR